MKASFLEGKIRTSYLVVYAFHPFERFSVEVGKRLEMDKPNYTDLMEFTPSSIDYRYLQLSRKERVKRNHLGYKELRNHIMQLYGEMPFTIVLHDYPLYASHVGEELRESYHLSYPIFNFKLQKTLNRFRKTHSLTNKIEISYHEMQSSPSYHSLTIEFYPVRMIKNGRFDFLTVNEAQYFVNNVVHFLKDSRDQVEEPSK